jgi:hypothetical protein
MGNILQVALSGAGYSEIVSSQASLVLTATIAALRYCDGSFAFSGACDEKNCRKEKGGETINYPTF